MGLGPKSAGGAGEGAFTRAFTPDTCIAYARDDDDVTDVQARYATRRATRRARPSLHLVSALRGDRKNIKCVSRASAVVIKAQRR